MDGLPALQFWACVLETLSKKTAKGNLERHKRERVILSHSHSDTCAFESIDHVPANTSNSSHSTRLVLFEDNAAVVHVIHKRRAPNLRQVTRTHRVDLDQIFDSELAQFYVCAILANKWSASVIFLTEGTFTTMQLHSVLHLLRNRHSLWIKCCPQRFSQTLLLHSFRIMTKAERIDQMWNPYSSKVLKLGCLLGDIVTFEQRSNRESTGTEDKRDFHAGMLFTMSAESNFLQIESSIRILRCKKLRLLVQ